MAKLPFVFCDGPHDAPCPNRVVRLLRELTEQGATFSQGCTAADVFRQIVERGHGGDDLSCEAVDGGDCPDGADKPRFDDQLGELRARGQRLHCFGAQACDEAAILKKFQDSRWCPKVFDPLGKSKSRKYGAWLKETVCRLNQCQRLIEFHSHPKSRAVSWKWRLP